jgi:hypothetical protein
MWAADLRAAGSDQNRPTPGAGGQVLTSPPTPNEIVSCDQRLANLRPGLELIKPSGEMEDWLPIEKRIWHHLCQRLKLTKEDWPSLASGLSRTDAQRNVHGAFIRAIVASNQFDVPGFDYIHIEGVNVIDNLDLSNEILRSGLAITNSTVNGSVTLNFFRSGHDIDFSNTAFLKGVVGQSMRVDGSVYFGKSASSSIKPSELVPITSLSLQKSDITGELNIHGIKMQRPLDLYGVSNGKPLEISDADLNDLILDLGHFRQIEVTNVTIDSLSAADLRVDGAVFLDRSKFRGNVDFTGAHIGSDFSIRGTQLSRLDLTGSAIDGELIMGQGYAAPGGQAGVQPGWVNPQRIILDHAKVGIISGPFNAWPPNRDLDGFSYAGFASPPKISDVQAWLDGSDFSPSAYRTLQQVLTSSGDDQGSRIIGIAGKNRERDKAWQDKRYADWLWLTIQWMLIGYGYNTWISLIWVFALTLFGAFAFINTSEAQTFNMPYGIAYSFDMLLPILRLREHHYEIDIKEWPQRYYFYFHKIMGFVLGSFIAAGLTGLTR